MEVASQSKETLSRRLHRDARGKRIPLSCLFELTPTCNLRCHFCYVALDPYAGPYLSTAQVCGILDTLERAGVLWLTLTGGEIFSRRDFPQIYRYAKSKGFLVTLFTNATMMNERLAELFRELPPLTVEVSIYGHNAEIYEKTTQIPGSFSRFERGIGLLVGAGIPVVLKTPISTITQHHLGDIVAYVQARGLKFKIDATIDARHDGGEQPKLYRIAARGIPALIDEMDTINYGAPQRSNSRPLPECSIESPDARADELYRCGAGRTGFFIDGLGNASHCVIDREPSFSMLEMQWDEIWARMGDWVTQPLPKDAPCSGCGLRHQCGNCPARSRLATGSPHLKDTYYCDISHELNGLPPLKHPDYRALARPLGSCAA
jgi:radical SAM protein with 4Fe4S-binding SPASM domain